MAVTDSSQCGIPCIGCFFEGMGTLQGFLPPSMPSYKKTADNEEMPRFVCSLISRFLKKGLDLELHFDDAGFSCRRKENDDQRADEQSEETE